MEPEQKRAGAEKEKKRDPLIDHPAVKLVRDTFRYCPSPGYRREIVVTAEHDMNLWREVVEFWDTPYVDGKGKKRKRNPLAFNQMMSEFDRRWFARKRE